MTGVSEDEARQTLEDAGFRVEVIRAGDGATVEDQQPEFGVTSFRGAVITLLVVRGGLPGAVPPARWAARCVLSRARISSDTALPASLPPTAHRTPATRPRSAKPS